MMGIAKIIGQGLAPVTDLVYPPRCPLCGDAIAKQNGLCTPCWASLAIPGEPMCISCGRPFGSDAVTEGLVCGPCLARPPRHAGVAAGTLYNDASRKLVLAFKHGGKIALAPLLAGLMAAHLPDADTRSSPLLVPVPLHRWRLWKRGYNQAALLAQALQKRGKGRAAVDMLVRMRATPALGGMGKAGRRRTLAGAIAVNPRRKSQLQGRDIILVDDVVTSGATSDACVACLLRGGAGSVRIACFARVLDEALDSVAAREQVQVGGS